MKSDPLPPHSKSRERFRINSSTKEDGKPWIEIECIESKWRPSFEDLFRIIGSLCICEDRKYPDGEGRGMIRRFVIACCEEDVTFAELLERFNIPYACSKCGNRAKNLRDWLCVDCDTFDDIPF